jgi:hypothetical protein
MEKGKILSSCQIPANNFLFKILKDRNKLHLEEPKRMFQPATNEALELPYPIPITWQDAHSNFYARLKMQTPGRHHSEKMEILHNFWLLYSILSMLIILQWYY